MEEMPNTRDKLVEDFRSVLAESGEDPQTIEYMLQEKNLAKLSDDEIRGFIDKYSNYNDKLKKANADIVKYNADLAKDKAELHDKFDKEGDEIINRLAS